MRRVLAAAFLFVIAGTAHAAPEPATLQLDVHRTRLDNGLRVVMLVDHTTPTIAVDVVYDVGARNEERGRSGFAYLLEHLMFQGSRNVPRGDHVRLVTSRGGRTDATTSADRTSFFESLPASELALGLWLEADRMRSLDVSASSFENQRGVVKEERRKGIENAVFGPASVRLDELVFQGFWPYEHPAVGRVTDLDAAQLGWVRSFHDSYYAPNNAVLAVTGDFDEAECLALVKRYFGEIPQKPNVPAFVAPPLPEQSAPRASVLEDAHAKLPAFFEGWVVPGEGEPDHYVLELVALLLADGDSSRLSQRLVHDRAVASSVESLLDGRRGHDAFQITVKLASGATLAEVEKLTGAELADLARIGPTEEEMKKLKNRMRARFLFGLSSNLARAELLAGLELERGDASVANGELARYLAVTKDDLKRVVARYLTAARRSLVEVKAGDR